LSCLRCSTAIGCLPEVERHLASLSANGSLRTGSEVPTGACAPADAAVGTQRENAVATSASLKRGKEDEPYRIRLRLPSRRELSWQPNNRSQTMAVMRPCGVLLISSVLALGCPKSRAGSSDAGQNAEPDAAPNGVDAGLDAGEEAAFCMDVLNDVCVFETAEGVTDSNCPLLLPVIGEFDCGDTAQQFNSRFAAACLASLTAAIDGGSNLTGVLYGGACSQALEGTAADRHSCASSWDCAAPGSLACVQQSSLCTGTCSSGAVGDPCVGGACDGGFCEPFSQVCSAYFAEETPCPTPRYGAACEPGVDYCGVGADGNSICLPRVANGLPCAYPTACAADEVCSPGDGGLDGGLFCLPGLSFGQLCNPSEVPDRCVRGLQCWFGQCGCGTDAVCVLSAAQIGEPCNALTVPCETGTCATDGGITGVCLPLASVGEACADGGVPCAFPLECVSGVCQGAPTEGSACGASASAGPFFAPDGGLGLPCREGDFCNAQNICQPLGVLGSACQRVPNRPVCLGGTCDGTGTCAAFLPAGASCDPVAFQCSADVACALTMPNDAGSGIRYACLDARCQIGDAGSVCVERCQPATSIPSGERDPLQWPFASTSIWNMPIGSAAVYVPANIYPDAGSPLSVDTDILILTPSAPMTPIYRNFARWDRTLDRCPVQGPLLFTAPIPANFLLPVRPAGTPNAATAILMPDGRTLKQTQPLSRCNLDQPPTSFQLWPDVDLYGDGVLGAHGGSWLSAIGGTLRVGELRPNQTPPRHALKVELEGDYFYNDGLTADTFRWPALVAVPPTLSGYRGNNPALRAGSLLALPANLAIASLGLRTAPAQMLAWTLQNYGAYVVDSAGSVNRFQICAELGPAGDFERQFQQDWGFPMTPSSTSHPFAQDMLTIIPLLQVVDNNGPSSIGGGGTPLQPLAPPLTPPR
jgi:hypothetical protein